jgi:hypothetical protein
VFKLIQALAYISSPSVLLRNSGMCLIPNPLSA